MKNPFRSPSHASLAQAHLEDAKHGLLNSHARKEQAEASVLEAAAAVSLYQARIARLTYALEKQ